MYKMWPRLAVAFAVAFVIGGTDPGAQTRGNTVANEGAEALKPFEALVGGRWALGDTLHHTFEWGVGRLSVKSKSYAVVDGEARLVSEATWFWHPGLKTIKAYATAIDMPVAMFDYSTRFEDGKLVSDLTAYSPDGTGQDYLETFEFTDANTYVWTLFTKNGDTLEEAMGGTFTRAR